MLVRFVVQVHLDESFDPESGEYCEPMDAYEYGDISQAVELIDKWRNKGWTIVRTFISDECGRELSDTLNIKR